MKLDTTYLATSGYSVYFNAPDITTTDDYIGFASANDKCTVDGTTYTFNGPVFMARGTNLITGKAETFIIKIKSA